MIGDGQQRRRFEKVRVKTLVEDRFDLGELILGHYRGNDGPGHYGRLEMILC